MQSSYYKGEVYSNTKITEEIYKIIIKGQFTGTPGQFFMLRAWSKEPFLSRPISIFNISTKNISFVYEVRGKGTNIFSKLQKGDSIYLLGPLGNGFKLNNEGKVAIVAGGIGIAPMFFLAKMLKCDIDFYVGFKDKPYLIEDIQRYVKKIYISTESGNEGYKGYITEIFSPERYSQVFSCGSIPMLKNVVNMCSSKNISSYISMESRMACGIGACLGCTIQTISGMKRVCKDGPVFLGEEVIFK